MSVYGGLSMMRRLLAISALACAIIAGDAALSQGRFSSCDASGRAKPGVTLVTQASVGRLKNLKLICDRWKGRLSLAIYV